MKTKILIVLFGVIFLILFLLVNAVCIQEYSLVNFRQMSHEISNVQNDQAQEIGQLFDEISKNTEHRLAVSHALKADKQDALLSKPKSLLSEIKALEKRNEQSGLQKSTRAISIPQSPQEEKK